MNNQIKRTLVFQYFAGGVYLFIAGLLNVSVLISAAVGCVAGLLPSTYFAMRMMRVDENKDAAQWLGYALRSEAGKWLTMGAIFAAAFSTDYDWDPVFLFVGYIVVLLSGWIAPLVMKGN